MEKNKIRLIETYKEFDEEIRLENEQFENWKICQKFNSTCKDKN